MSCIAGVGGGVKKLVNIAQSSRPIIALDGCALHCVKHCLNNHEIEATHHYTLTDFGIKKQYNLDFDTSDVALVKQEIINNLGVKSEPS